MKYLIQNPVDGSFLACGEYLEKIVAGEIKPIWGRIWTHDIKQAMGFGSWSLAEATAGNLFWNFCQQNPAFSYMTAIKECFNDMTEVSA